LYFKIFFNLSYSLSFYFDNFLPILEKHGFYDKRVADLMDKILAEKIKKKRLEMHCTQKTIAKMIGVSTQQYQKYETAKNNISATKFFQIAQFLNMDLNLFFPQKKSLQEDVEVYGDSLNDKTQVLIYLFSKIKKEKVRDKVIAMVKIIANDEDFLIEEKYD
jgi:transcriptional regulator with XRE-family HTH domain